MANVDHSCTKTFKLLIFKYGARSKNRRENGYDVTKKFCNGVGDFDHVIVMQKKVYSS